MSKYHDNISERKETTFCDVPTGFFAVCETRAKIPY